MEKTSGIPTRFASLALGLFILAVSLGVAGQYIAGVLALACMAFGVGRPDGAAWRAAWRAWRQPTLWALAYVAWLAVAGYANPQYPDSPWPGLAGYIDWLLWGVLIAAWASAWPRGPRPGLGKWTMAWSAAWAAVALAQYLFAWKLEGLATVADIHRARGFYSHPLTLAYVALVLWAPLLEAVLARRGGRAGQTALAAVAVLLLTSLSRTAQALAALYAIMRGLVVLPRRSLAVFLVAVAVVLGALGVVDNPIRERFRRTFSGEGVDRHQNIYPDDRMAFWDAHRLMIQERPWMGHGPDLDRAYRAPYYARLGLGDFKKQYEAHNQYLQITAEGGVVGLALWLAWLVALWRVVAARSRRARWAMTGMVALFALGGLTQNAFHDAEVRFTFTVAAAFLWVYCAEGAEDPRREAAEVT